MRRTTILAIIFCVMLVSICRAQDQSPKVMAETFFRTLQGGKIPQSYDQLFAGSPILQTKPQAVETVKRQTESGLQQLGKILGFELIREEKFGTAIIRFVYLLKLEKSPTIWEFYFYKPKATWFLVNLMFNDQFNLLDAKQ